MMRQTNIPQPVKGLVWEARFPKPLDTEGVNVCVGDLLPGRGPQEALWAPGDSRGVRLMLKMSPHLVC